LVCRQKQADLFGRPVAVIGNGMDNAGRNLERISRLVSLPFAIAKQLYFPYRNMNDLGDNMIVRKNLSAHSTHFLKCGK